MFVGHYGVALAIRAGVTRPRLGTLFLAVQGLDIVHASLLLAGLEHIRIVSDPTSRTIYDTFQLYDIPLSHSLVGALFWTAAAIFAARTKFAWKESLWIGIAVLSHFVLDIPMHPNDPRHPPDLHLAGSRTVGFGLGLWNHPKAAVATELCTFLAGAIWYAVARWPVRPRFWFLIGILSSFTILPLFLSANQTETTFAIQILTMTILIALWARWVDDGRQPPLSEKPQIR
jgi:hypothetical protein